MVVLVSLVIAETAVMEALLVKKPIAVQTAPAVHLTIKSAVGLPLVVQIVMIILILV
jgi:hypothetical protein